MSNIETGLVRHSDPDTSRMAAELVDAPKLMREIWLAMTQFGEKGCIGDEVQDALPHLDNQTISPRYIQMIKKGMIELTGEKRRGTHNGRMQLVRRICLPPFVAPLELTTNKYCPHCGETL